MTCLIPSASIFTICSGIFFGEVKESSAGTRLSKTIVVLPEPETPVTTVNLPFGMSIFRGLTVWIEFVSKWILPFLNIISGEIFSRIFTSSLSDKKPPIIDFLLSIISGIVPSATT